MQNREKASRARCADVGRDDGRRRCRRRVEGGGGKRCRGAPTRARRRSITRGCAKSRLERREWIFCCRWRSHLRRGSFILFFATNTRTQRKGGGGEMIFFSKWRRGSVTTPARRAWAALPTRVASSNDPPARGAISRDKMYKRLKKQKNKNW